MTRAEILRLAAIELRDTSPNFIADVLNPIFDTVLLELGRAEAIGAQRASTTFEIRENVRSYETREITQLTPHYPNRIVQLVVYAWGITEGRVRRANTPEEFEQLRLAESETHRGRWQLWRIHPNNRLLEVTPPADHDNDGVLCEVTFERAPHLIALDQDVTDVELEDIPTIVEGLKAHGAPFSEDTAGQLPAYVQLFELGKRRMWGRRWNNRAGRIRGTPF